MLCELELLFMRDLVLLRLKKIILMILLQAVMMLVKVAFRKDTGLADVNENYSKDTPHDKERK